ncbi:MAG: LysR family transcriptional regulator (chromosome initiation inhibitor) [Paraglaciecola sp.]|jgi:LysR family transcriptional regulator (chromosome initiation inhibitor)
MLDYRLLAALAAVVQEGGFERAAQILFITQSAISQRIKQLEAQLGQPVLIRSTPPSATTLGQKLHNHWQQVQQMEASLNLLEETVRLTIRIALNADSLATWLPAALVGESLQNISYDLIVEDQGVALKRMRQGEVMACVCSDPKPLNGGKVVRLGGMRYRPFASPEFMRRYQINQLSNKQLADIPCLIFNRDDALQHQFTQYMAGTEPSHIHLCPSSEGFVQCALAGVGYGLLPELQIRQHMDSGQLTALVPNYYVDVPLYWHYWRTESPIMASLRQRVCIVAAEYLEQDP